jgi:hypothetical protein
MRQRIHDHFREALCMVVILEKPVTFVVKIAKISSIPGPSRCWSISELSTFLYQLKLLG